MREEDHEGYLPPEKEATVDEMSYDGVSRRSSFENYLERLTDSCRAVEKLYFHVPLVTEISDEEEFKAVLGYRERVYCYELYHQLRLRIGAETSSEGRLYLNAEMDKSGTVYKNWVGRRKPDFILHRPGEGGHNIGITEVKPIVSDIKEMEADMKKLKEFLDPKGMNYFGAVALIFGNADGLIGEVEKRLATYFGKYWSVRFKALWHRKPGERPEVWDKKTGRFRVERRGDW